MLYYKIEINFIRRNTMRKICENCKHYTGERCVTSGCKDKARFEPIAKSHIKVEEYTDDDKNKVEIPEEQYDRKCRYTKENGERCKRKAEKNSIYCWQHP